MAGKLPRSQQIKRSHFRTDGEFLAALRKQRPADTQKAFLNRCARAERYQARRAAQAQRAA